MQMMNSDVLQPYFPLFLVMISAEIILSITKSGIDYWTTRLAIFNLCVNLSWIGLFTAIAVEPHLFSAAFVQQLADQYNTSFFDVSIVLYVLAFILILAFSITSFIDVLSTFTNRQTDKKSEP